MDKCRKIIVGFVLWFPLSAFANDCSTALINWSDYNETLGLIKESYHAGKYKSVEQTLACLLESNKTFISGKPGSVAAYWFYRNEMHAPGANEEDRSRIDRWKQAVPGSKFAKFAELRFSYSQAWNARGTKFANETTDDQFKRYKQKLLETETLILSERNGLKETPISYNLLMAVTLDTDGTQSSAMDVFNYGVAKWPNYYDFYEVLLTRLVPKWGGSWENVDDFINYWASKLQQAEENTVYARFYHNVHKHNGIDPRSTLADWSKLKPSLVNLYTKYPAKEYLAIAASYGCIYGDRNFYNKVVTENKVVTSSDWISGTSKEACDSFFNSRPNIAVERDAPPKSASPRPSP